MSGSQWVIPAVVALCASLFAAITDTCRFKVHNALTFPLALSGLIYHTFSHGTQGFVLSAAGIGVGLLVLIVPYMIGALGAGDVKFFAAVSAWLGMSPMFTILIAACLATGLYAVVTLLRRGGLRGVWLQLQITCMQLCTFGRRGGPMLAPTTVQDVLAHSPDYRQRLIPFTAMIGVGVLAAVVRQAWFVS